MQVVNLDSRATEALPSLPVLLNYRSRIQDISSDVNILRMLRAAYKTFRRPIGIICIDGSANLKVTAVSATEMDSGTGENLLYDFRVSWEASLWLSNVTRRHHVTQLLKNEAVRQVESFWLNSPPRALCTVLCLIIILLDTLHWRKKPKLGRTFLRVYAFLQGFASKWNLFRMHSPVLLPTFADLLCLVMYIPHFPGNGNIQEYAI